MYVHNLVCILHFFLFHVYVCELYFAVVYYLDFVRSIYVFYFGRHRFSGIFVNVKFGNSRRRGVSISELAFWDSGIFIKKSWWRGENVARKSNIWFFKGQ